MTFDAKEDYLVPIEQWSRKFKEYSRQGQSIPREDQREAALLMHEMVLYNLNNQNKHLFEDGEQEALLWSIGEVFSHIEDAVILDPRLFPMEHKEQVCFRWVYLILKYRDRKLEFEFWKSSGEEWVFGYHGVEAGELSGQTADIQFMNVEGDRLVIEGRLSPIALMQGSQFGVMAGDCFYPARMTERYAHTKAFGVTIFKRYAFTIEVPLQEEKLEFVTRGSWGEAEVSLEFDSHFSRITDRFAHSYWHLSKELVMLPRKHALLIRKKHMLWLQECRLWMDMIKTGQKNIIKYIPVRFFLFSRKIWKRRPIWLFLDKIYKAGDSSEYLFRYAMEQKDGIRKYYLIDRDCKDRQRLEKDGYRPILRRSLKHRLIFLSADMIIISNSTVYAFNDFSTKNSAYIRDLMNFHTVCVQHGMSVQKIAVAQNRLRDNIRLYFCASPYEIANLSRPIYGYEDTDALKLTGVPRYDGLVNRDQRQILISPTWRMQAAVKVTKNEGVARDYNPNFRETSYYKVYNSLINDPRLIGAAKKFGYRIVYVLHPIVSPQAGDFDRNDYVDIIPATGDMSYEKIFCESSLMVTDYSGVQFDFAYMRKPLVYLHHREIPQHYEEGTFHYDTMAFGEICHDNEELIGMLCDYMEHDCRMKPEYVKRADDFFAFRDHKNCERIYQVMIEYERSKLQ